MRPILLLKQGTISPPTTTSREDASSAVDIAYGAVGFQIKQGTSPSGAESLEVVYGATGFQIRGSVAPYGAEDLTVGYGANEFIFKRHMSGQSDDALGVGFAAMVFEFKTHPAAESADTLAVTSSAIGFEFTGNASAALWDPLMATAVPRLLLDDKSTITHSAGNVSVWSDRSASNSNMEQPDNSYQPSAIDNALNARRIMRFAGADRMVAPLARTLLTSVESGWMFVVMKKAALDGAATTRAVATIGASSYGNSRLGIWNGRSEVGTPNALVLDARRLDADAVGRTNSAAVTTDWTMVLVTVNYVTRLGRLYVNGDFSSENTTITAAGGVTDATESAAVSIGAVGDGSSPWSGDLAAVLAGRGIPTLSDMDRLSGYYAHRFGLQDKLAADHPYKMLPPYPRVTPVKFLFEGANNSTVFTDESSVAKTWTRVGSPVISTAQFYTGDASFYNAPGVAGSLNTPHHDHFDLSTEDFCISVMLRPTGSHASSVNGTVISKRVSSTDFDWVLYQDQATRAVCFSYGDTNTARRDMVSAAGSLPVDTWTHVAVSRYRNTLRLWINGTLAVTHTIVGALRHRALAVEIGKSLTFTDTNWAGWIDALEITRGEAVYYDTFATPSRSKTHIQKVEDAVSVTPFFTSALTRTAVWTDSSPTVDLVTVSPFFTSAQTRLGQVSHTQKVDDAVTVAPFYTSAQTSLGLVNHTQQVEDAIQVAPIFISAGTSTP